MTRRNKTNFPLTGLPRIKIIGPLYGLFIVTRHLRARLEMNRTTHITLSLLAIAMSLSGCATDHTSQGALFGGAAGAGAGAIIGHAAGNTGAGAAIGAGVGALTGAAVGSEKDEQDARARAAMDQARAQQAMAAAVGVPDVVAMTRARVDENLIIDRIHTHGIAAPLQTNDVIYLHNQGVSGNVIAAMQSQPVATQMAPPGQYYYPPPPGAVIVDEGYYYGRPRYYYPPPAVGVGFSFRR
jgi:hypothetical protein